MEDREKASGTPILGGSRGRGAGRFNPAPRSERKSLEVFGGAPASTRYLPGNGTSFGGKSVPEGEEFSVESTAPPPPTMRIEPPWAPPITPKPNPANVAEVAQTSSSPSPRTPPKPIAAEVAQSSSSSSPSAPPIWTLTPNPRSSPEPKLAEPKPWEINLDVPEYKPKPVIGSDENPAPKPVIRHKRSNSDNLKIDKLNLAEERQLAIDKLKKQAEEDAKSDLAKRIDLAKKLAVDAAANVPRGSKSPEKEEMTEEVMADRVAEWGLVLKADAETGKLQGVQTRRSGDRSSGDRR